MSVYRFSELHDVILANLNPITPQPTGDPVAPVERTYGASGVIHNRGLFTKWHWDFIESPEAYLALLIQLGLDDRTTREVTIYTRDERFQWKRYNAIAHLPEPMQDMKWRFFVVDLDIYFTDLELLA